MWRMDRNAAWQSTFNQKNVVVQRSISNSVARIQLLFTQFPMCFIELVLPDSIIIQFLILYVESV
jgi:hypothetical protein